MKAHHSFGSLAFTAMLALVPALAADEEPTIHVCHDEKGDEVYQTDPCSELVPEKPTPSAPAPRAAPQRAPKRAPAPPAPRAATSWTLVPRSPGTTPEHRSALGKQSFPTRLGDAARAAPPSFVSPESTWRTFLAALETGDRVAAAACLTPAALKGVATDAASFPLDAVRRTVGSFVRIENEGDLGVFWSAYGVRKGNRPKWILFERTAGGKWKIAGI